jgi:proteasome assembly chaperone 1
MNEDNIASYPDDVEQFVIFEGHQITDFVNTAILKGTTPLCQLTTGCVTVYNLPNTKIVVCVAEEKDLNNFGPITDMLLPWLDRARRVVGVSFQSSVSYKGLTEVEMQATTFVRGLNSGLADVPEMLVPNLLTGVAAGAVSYRTFREQEVACYAVFMESQIFDSVSTAPILKLIDDLKIPCDKVYNFRSIHNSNLYL